MSFFPRLPACGVGPVVEKGDHLAIQWPQGLELHLRTDFLHGPLRAQIVRAHVEPDTIGPVRRMTDRQTLELAIRGAAPESPREEGVADCHLPLGGIPVVVTRRANDL